MKEEIKIMYFAVHIMEDQYQGLHGIERFFIWEADNEEELYDDAYRESEDLIISFGLEDEIAQEVEWQFGEEEDFDENYDDYFSEMLAERTYYVIYPLDKLKIEEKDVPLYTDELCNNEKEFLEKYCSTYKTI
jgi:hypothetical protein